jgi:hypothetical protein
MSNRVVPAWTSFNAGELSPLMDGRTDQDKYFSGTKRQLNFIPRVTGPTSRRGGSRYLGTTKNNGAVDLRPFEFSAAQSYVLEFGNQYLRFWVNRGLLLNGGSPYEIATPFTSANLINSEGSPALRSVQSGDIAWMCHAEGAVAPQKLQRFGATNWTISPSPFLNGPFNDVNPSNTITVSASAETGVVTLTASSAIFTSAMIGTSFYMESNDPGLINAWSSDRIYTVGNITRYQGNVYEITSVGITPSASPPVHLRGSARDVPNSATYLYLHSGYGWVQITAVASGTSATATVISRLPAAVTGAGNTVRWAKAAFDSQQGWPTAVGFYRERLVWGRGRQLFFSVVGSFDDHSAKEGPDVTAETAIRLTLSVDKLDAIRWLSQNNALLLSGSRNEVSVSEQTVQKVFAADNVKGVPQTEYGGRLLPAFRVGDAVLFVQRGGKKLREMKYSFEIDRFKADDLTVLADHILQPGVLEMDFALEPDSVLHCVLANGTLASLVYNRDRGVIAWAPQQLGGSTATTSYGVVESIACISSPDTSRDDTWLCVRRVINGSTVRYVEVIESNRLSDTDKTDAFYVDSGLTYSGAPVTTITGLGHLEGQTVQVLADGGVHADCVVASGQITLNRPASKAQIGLGFTSILQTMRPEAGAQDGSGQTRRRSISNVFFRFDKSLGGKAGPSLDRLDPLPGAFTSAAVIGDIPELYSGDREIAWPATFDTDAYIYLVQDQPLPMTVVAIVPRMVVND